MANYLPVPLDFFAGHDLSELETKATQLDFFKENTQLSVEGVKTQHKIKKVRVEDGISPPTDTNSALIGQTIAGEGNYNEQDREDEGDEQNRKDEEDEEWASKEEEGGNGESEDKNTDGIYLGLRVYTNKAAPAKVGGQLRRTSEPWASLASKLEKDKQCEKVKEV